MMGHKAKLISGNEYDALTLAKKNYNWKPGQRKQIKRIFNKRQRLNTKEIIREDIYN